MKRRTDFGDKPYNRCLACPHRKVSCDGPRTSGMPLERWCEYMRDMKEVNGLTNLEIAEASGVSIKTIERIMALNAEQDIMRDTARRVENAVIGSTSKYPCYLAYLEENRPGDQKLIDATRDLEQALAENKEFRISLEQIRATFCAEVAAVRAEDQQKIDYLKEQLERLHAENVHLWAENDRKSRLVDRFLDNK